MPPSKTWLACAPSDQKFVWETGDCTTQITTERIIRYMKAHVAVVCLKESITGTERIEYATKLIPSISSLYAQWASPCTKTIVFVDQGISYKVPIAPTIVHTEGVRCCDDTPHMIYMGRDMAYEAAHFGNAVIYCIIKRGACVDTNNEDLLKMLSRALKAPRYEKIIIITDTESSDAELNRTRQIFKGYDVSYAVIDY